MTKVRLEKVEQHGFGGRADSELGQTSDNQNSQARLFRRWILILLPIALGHCLVLLYFQWFNLSSKHSHPVGYGPAAEHTFLSIPNAKNARKLLRQYAGKPHMAGTDRDFETAEIFLANFQESFGIPRPRRQPVFDAGSPESQAATRGITERDSPYAWIDTYYPVMKAPLDQALQIIDDNGSVLWDADLTEHTPEGDDDAVKYADAVPAFHGMSATGDVTGHLLDGNYCSKEDYDDLLAKGAPIEGSILFCRYGDIARGLKVKGAQENGAVGVLIYSDPRDDGAVTVENGFAPYPEGPARNPTSVERGSVLFALYVGDPTTPGYPSYPNATRTEITNIPSIPSLPISWNNAKHLLKIFQSGNSLERKRVRVFNNVKTEVTPIWNVMGVIPGHIKDEVVLAGNHRDAWVMGAADPSSGTVSFHEVIRGLGHLVKKGWKPLRTIVIGSWDGEEDALIGSTEWGEDFADWIDENVVAYFNVDSSVSGSRFGVVGSPILAHFIRNTAQDIPHPTDSNRTLWDAQDDDGPLSGTDFEDPCKNSDVIRIAQTALGFASTATGDSLDITPLGSGSDFTVFVQRNGVPSNNVGFEPAPNDPIYHYHSVFDTPTWQEKYGDPSFSRHVAIAQFLGLQIMRMATDLVLPLNTTHYALQLEDYLDTVRNLPETKRLGLDLTKLRYAIQNLQSASFKLDKEKQTVQQELKRVSYHWWRHGGSQEHRHHSSRPPHDGNILARLFYPIKAWIASWNFCITKIPHLPSLDNHPQNEATATATPNSHYLTEFSEVISNVMTELTSLNIDRVNDLNNKYNPNRILGRHVKWRNALFHPIRQVQKINRKLRSFERGFISEEGIKGREWFRNLVVAPGKWLGYGATTFPGLTEAIVFDHDKDAAEFEMERLISLLYKLTVTLEE